MKMKQKKTDPQSDESDPGPYNTVIGEGELSCVVEYDRRMVIFYPDFRAYKKRERKWGKRFTENILPPFPCNGGILVLTENNTTYHLRADDGSII